MDTLVREPFYDIVPAFFGVSLETLLREKHPSAWAEFERGEIDEAALRTRFFRDGRDYDHEGMKRAMVDAYAWLPGMQELSAELASAGFALHALSNYPDWYRLIEERLALSRFVAWSFVSCDMGVRKPDPRAYTLPLERLGVPAEECLFIDDRAANCEAASALGIDAIRFTGARELRSVLAQRGLLAAAPG